MDEELLACLLPPISVLERDFSKSIRIRLVNSGDQYLIELEKKLSDNDIIDLRRLFRSGEL